MSVFIICKLTGGYIDPVVLGEFLFAETCSQKRIDHKKFPFIATNSSIALAVQRSIKYFLLRISKYCGKVKQQKKEMTKASKCKVFCFSSKCKKDPVIKDLMQFAELV